MKLAVITPPEYLKLTRDQEFHLPLAPLVLSNREYANYHRSMAAREDRYVILDNGAAEGNMPDYNGLARAVELCRPNEFVMPDVLRNMKATLEACLNPTIERIVMGQAMQLMYVPQGDSPKQWVQCLKIMMEWGKVYSVGIPKWAESLEGGRANLILCVKELGFAGPIHLLGVYGRPFAEVNAAVAAGKDQVRSIDTCAPVAFAQQWRSIEDRPRESLDWDGFIHEGLAAGNIAVYRAHCVCKGPRK
jgi:hypothetical protein